MLAAIKKAEDSDAIIVRLYETEGRDTEARVRITDLVKPGSPAREVDLMEQPLQKNTARMDGNTLVVRIPAHGIATVAAG
jgi:alpha-mannosidase